MKTQTAVKRLFCVYINRSVCVCCGDRSPEALSRVELHWARLDSWQGLCIPKAGRRCGRGQGNTTEIPALWRGHQCPVRSESVSMVDGEGARPGDRHRGTSGRSRNVRPIDAWRGRRVAPKLTPESHPQTLYQGSYTEATKFLEFLKKLLPELPPWVPRYRQWPFFWVSSCA